MTESNPLQVTEQSSSDVQFQLKFWGVIAITVMAMLAYSYVLLNLFKLEPATAVYIKMVVYALAIILSVTSFVLAVRRQVDMALTVIFYYLLILLVSGPSTTQGRTLASTSTMLVVGILMIGWLLPKPARRRNSAFLGSAYILAWVFEWINPPWRIVTGAALVGPIVAILFTFILIFLVARQAWGGNIRLKIVTGFTVIALVSLGILGTVTYINFSNQVREDFRQRLINMVSIAALQQDGDLHASIQNSGDEETEAYKQMQAVNKAIVATEPEVAYLYTMRMNEQGQVHFFVDAGQPGDDDLAAIMEEYVDPTPLMVAEFPTLDRAIAESEFYTDRWGTWLTAYAPFYNSNGEREGIIGMDIGASTVIAQERGVLYLILGTTAVAMVIMTLLGLWLGTVFTRPILGLSQTAQKVAEGDLSARAEIETTDEIGDLARIFNATTTRLQEILRGLEQRVAARTKDLELAAEVGRAVSQVREQSVMLNDACQLILEQFDLYYVQVYLINQAQTELQIHAGTGEVGKQLLERNFSLPLNTGSLNGRAAIEKRAIVIPDTELSTTFRKNPALPETRGEMAVPLMVGDQVVGVLDMQTRYPGKLTEEVLPAFETLAGQLAVAIQNANLLEEAKQAREELEAQARRQVRASWDEHLDAIHKPEHFGFMFDRQEVVPLNVMEETDAQDNEQTVSSPIYLSGEELGALVVEIEDEERKEQTSELVTIVARQVAQQIENLRLLESAERYRQEAEEAARRQTVEGWQAYLASRTADHLGYMYDLNEVRPHSNGQDDATALTLPLKARDEKVGKLSIHGLAPDDRESFELANAVAERLGAHIESLRLFEETRRGQVELDKRAQQLAAVAKVSTASSQELDVQKMLATVVHLTQRQFGLYHAHVFTYNEASEELAIVACGYKEGDEHEGTHGTTTIPLSQEQSLVARAARTRQAVVVNDVHNEPGWLPNPLLPETQSELAVPLLIGDQLLGVLDVQSEYLNHFTQEDANIQLTLASQVAIALQNAYSYAQAQKQAERESLLNTINQKIQSATSVEAVLQIAARELGHALGAPMTIAQLSLKDQN